MEGIRKGLCLGLLDRIYLFQAQKKAIKITSPVGEGSSGTLTINREPLNLLS